MIGNDLTRGSVLKTLVKFTVPFLLAHLMQTLYSLVDVLIVGKFSDSAQLSAVSISALMMSCIGFVVTGMATGATVAVGQLVGAKREKDLREMVSTVYCVIMLLVVCMFALFMSLRHRLLGAMNTPPESYAGAEAYFRICLFGLLFTGMYHSTASVLRGLGESKAPTLFIVVSCCCNVVGDLICVGLLDMGAAGAALATTVSQGVSVAFSLLYLRRRSFPFNFRPSSWRIKKDKLKTLLRISIPTALQEAMIAFSFIFLETILNGLGYISVAAGGVCDRVFDIIVVPGNAFFAAIAAMTAQNFGADKPERGKRCMYLGALMALGVSLFFFILMTLFPAAIIGCFTRDPEVVAAGVVYMTYYKYDFLLFSLACCVNGYIIGSGHARYAMAGNLLSALVVRMPLLYLLSRIPGATLLHIGVGLPTASAVQVLMGAAFLLFAKSERERRKSKLICQ